MNKILLVLVTILFLSVNNTSAFSDDFSGGLVEWTVDTGAGWSGASGKAYHTVTVSAFAQETAQVHHDISGTYTYFSVDMNETILANADNDFADFVFQSNGTTEKYIRHIGNQIDILGDGMVYAEVTPISSSGYTRIIIESVGDNYEVELYSLPSLTLLDSQTISKGTTITNPNIIYLRDSVDSNHADPGYLYSHWDNVIVANSNPDTAGTGTITFDAEKYDLGDVAYISSSLINPDYDTYNYRTVIIDPLDNIINAHTWNSGALTETNYPLNIIMQGTYTAKLQRYASAISYDYLSTDTALAGYLNNQSLITTFDEYFYNTGDTVNIHSNITNIDNTNYFYEVMIIKPNGNFYNVHNITANESYNFVTDVPGEWNTVLTAYPKSEPSMIENQATDSMFTYGAVQGASWVAYNETYYNKNSWARINYGISTNDFIDSHKMQITNQEGTVVFDRQIIAQSGYFDYYFYESGKYTVTIDRNWFALDWDLTDNEILATDVTEVTNTIEGGYTLGITPTTLNCGQTVYLSADTPNFWNTTNFTIVNVSGTIVTTIYGQSNKWKTNQTGQFWVYLNDDGAVQDSGYFYVYGTCTGYDQISQDGQGGIQPKQYPQTDQATSNEGLQNNLLYFLGLPIFWGLIIYVGVIYMLAINGAGSTVPFVTPVIIFMELAIGMLDPYSAFVVVGVIIVYVLGFIAKVFSVSVGDTVSSVTHIGKK